MKFEFEFGVILLQPRPTYNVALSSDPELWQSFQAASHASRAAHVLQLRSYAYKTWSQMN